MDRSEEIASVAKVMVQLGAGEEQAGVMARQLCKRADQLSESRGIPREEAMRHLLEVLVKGKSGDSVEI